MESGGMGMDSASAALAFASMGSSGRDVNATSVFGHVTSCSGAAVCAKVSAKRADTTG